LAVGHRGSMPFTEDEVSDVLSLGELGSAAIERLRQVRVRAATVPRLARTDTSAEIEITYHASAGPGAESIATRRAALSELRTDEAWSELADAIRDLVLTGMQRGDPGEDEQLELFLELGHIEADRLNNVNRAIDAWRSALAIDARDERVLEALHQTL